MASRRLLVRGGMVVIVLGTGLLAWRLWPRPSVEQQVRRVLQELADGIAGGRMGPVRHAIDDAYGDTTGLTKDQIMQYLNRLTPLNPEVFQIEYDAITVTPIDEHNARADVRGRLRIQTRKERTTLQEFEGTAIVYFSRQSGRWRIIAAEGWHDAARRAGFGHEGFE